MMNIRILKKYIFVSMIVATLAILSGCGYSIWDYEAVERKLDNADSWSMTFGIGRYGGGPSISKISLNDTLSYSFAYFIQLKEKDTIKHERLSFRVDDIWCRYSSEDEPIALKKFTESYSYEYKGAKSFYYMIDYGPFLLSMPLPDTIWCEQNVTIFFLESGEELTSFHHVVESVLDEGKYSHFMDFVRGT